MGFRELPTRQHNARRVMHPNSMGTKSPALEALPHLALCISPSGGSSVSFIMSFNKPVTLSVSLSSVNPSSKLIESEEDIVGAFNFVTKSDISCNLGTYHLLLGFEVGWAQFVRLSP